MKPFVDSIFVPQGAEYQAVMRGLRAAPGNNHPEVVPLRIGPTATQAIAEDWIQRSQSKPMQTAILLGLCGGLREPFAVGQAVLCETCWDWQRDQPPLTCDRTLNATILARQNTLPLVTAITSDRLLHTAQGKQAIARDRGVDIVDMEGYPLLCTLQKAGLHVTMLRVVSDDCHGDVPDLSSSISEAGTLQPLSLALSFLRQPVGAVRLIRGSLTGLNVLQHVVTALVST